MAATRDGGELMRGRARRAAGAPRGGQAAGRHERRPHLVDVAGCHPQPAPGATRATDAGGPRGTQAMGPGTTRATQTRDTRAAQATGPGTTRATQTRSARAAQAAGLRAARATQAGGVRATRAGRSRHAARPGWASWAERGRRVAGQAREWWAEGAERVAARARERWTEQVAGVQRGTGGERVAAVRSAGLVVAMTAFFFQYVSPVVAWRRPGLAGLPAGSPFVETVQVYELLGLLVHNLFFVAPVLLLLLRWQTPLGTFTVMAGSVALLLATQTEFGLVGLVGAAVLGGTAADVAVRVLRPSPQRRWAARAVAVVAPAVYWSSHFALLRAGYGVSWELELWLGSVVWASLSGLTLALLMWPPAVPLTAWNRGRAPAARSAATPTPMPARMVGR